MHDALRLDWDCVDTVLVDMDGTLLDLAFDNFFWLELVPAQYAERHGIPYEQALSFVTSRYAGVAGSLQWYCVDHWTGELGIDIKQLKWSHKHLMRYLPRAEEFLTAVRARGKRVWIVTNAHPETVAVKKRQTNIDGLVDGLISSHDFRVPKESPAFWRKLEKQRVFDARRTLLIEDSVAVLTAGTACGVEHMLAIRQPDSSRPPRDIAGFPAVNGVAELI